MNRLRTWTSSLLSRVDWMVTQVENHEALADEAITLKFWQYYPEVSTRCSS